MAESALGSDPRVELVARARQELAHGSALVPRPVWEELTEQERTIALLEARKYLLAADAAGLLDAAAEQPDSLVSRVESLIGDLRREGNFLSLRDTSGSAALVMMRRLLRRLEAVQVNGAVKPSPVAPTSDA